MSIAGTFCPTSTFAGLLRASEVPCRTSLHSKVLGQRPPRMLRCARGRRIVVDRFRVSRFSKVESGVRLVARSRSLYFLTLSKTHFGSATMRSRSEGDGEVGNITVEV
jgi:hypothetical protein